MKWSTVLPLAISAVSLLPSTGAWEITWNDADNEKHTRTGHGPSSCIEIDNPKGHVFKIDAQGEKGIDMLLFPNSQCKGKEVGSATEEFTKESSRDLLGFRVVSLSSASSSESTATKKSTSHDAVSSTVASLTKTKTSSSTESARSTTTQSKAATTSAGTKTSGSATVPSSSASPATTSNVAVQMGVSNGNAAMGVVGGILGVAFVQWII